MLNIYFFYIYFVHILCGRFYDTIKALNKLIEQINWYLFVIVGGCTNATLIIVWCVGK